MGLTQVSTDGVKNDAITKTKIPANQIETSELADNAVTLGKLFQGTATGFIASNNNGNCTVPTYPSYSGDTVIVHDLQCQKDSNNVDPVIDAAGGGTNLTFRTNQNGASGAGLASILDLNGLQLGRMNEYVKLAAPTDQSGQASYTFTFPPISGTSGQVLSTNGSGTTSWTTVTGTTINNNADNRLITGSGSANTLEGEANLTYDGNELKAVLGSTSPKLTLKRSSNVDSANNIFSQVSAQDASGNVIGELTWRRETANDESYLDLETKQTGISNAQASVRIKGSNGTLYAVGNNGRSINNQPAYMNDAIYGGATVNSAMTIRTRTNGGETGLLVRGVSQGGGSTDPHSCIRVDATECGNNADQYGIYNRVRQQLVKDTTGYYATVSASYGTTYCFRADLEKNVGAYTNGYSFFSKITQTNSGGNSYHFRGDQDGTQRIRIELDGDIDNSNNSYGSLSDVKLKENIVDASSQWEDIKAIKVRNYNFKSSTGLSTHKQIGVVAQELETVSAGLVKTENDIETNKTSGEGTITGTTKSVKYSILYMKAIKALQEAMAKIEVLETKVAALEAG